jgi:hypothetical protein
MNITGALIAYLAWFRVMVFALAATLIAGVRRGRRGLIYGGKMLLGGLLMFGLISGVIGINETTSYAQTLPFGIGLALGLTGLVLFCLGSRDVWNDRL